jgi:hypothetical protein
MRTRPTALEQSGTASDYQVFNATSSSITCSAVPAYSGSTTDSVALVELTVSSGLVAGNSTAMRTNSSSGYLGFPAEL